MGCGHFAEIDESAMVVKRAVNAKRAAVAQRVIDALVGYLPPTGSVWPADDRKRWLDAMAAALILKYGMTGSIKTTVDGDAVRVEAVK